MVSYSSSLNSVPKVALKSSIAGLRLDPVQPVAIEEDVGLGLVEVVLVLDVADDLLQHVLDGQQPGHAAVLVHHDGHVVAVAAEVLEQHVEPLRLGDEHRRPQHLAHVELLSGEVAQQVLGEKNADDVVLALADDREARVTGLDDLGQELLGFLVDVHHVHLRARHHDVARLQLGHLQHALDHGERVGIHQVALVGRMEQLEQAARGLPVRASGWRRCAREESV